MLAVSVLELRPPDTLSEASWPQSTLIFMGDLMLKESFCSLHPSFPLRMLPYLKALYPPAARRYEVALSVRKQLDCCVALFSRRQTKFALADLNAVMEASAALRYHCDAELVANFVLACADLCSSEDADQLQLEQVRAVLLAALKSPVAALRGHCYAALHQLVIDLDFELADAAALQGVCDRLHPRAHYPPGFAFQGGDHGGIVGNFGPFRP